jgi:hypothetical protein
MLQHGDEAWISRVVAPLDFKLKNGIVSLAIPRQTSVDGPEEYMRASADLPVFPVSQDQIEREVRKRQRLDHCSNLAAHFADYLAIFDAIYIASGALTRSGNSATDDPELELWLVWQRQVTERFTKARTYSEVTMPPFPILPKWVENREDFEAAINEL